MAGESVGNLAVVLSADDAPFRAGINSAADALRKFNKMAESVKGGGTFDMRKLVAGAREALAAPVQSALNLASNLPGAYGAAAASAATLWPVVYEVARAVGAQIEAGRQSVAELDRMRRTYGVTTQAVAGFRLSVTASGADSEDAAHVLNHLHRALGDAGQGSDEAQRHFRRLGLDGIALARMPLNESLQQVARRFREMPSASDRASAAALLFGRRWADSLRVLDQLGDQERYQRIAANFGATLSPEALARFERHRASGRELAAHTQAAGQGATQQLYDATAPTLSFVNDLGTRSLEILAPVLQNLMLLVRAGFVPLNALIALIEGAAEVVQPMWQEILAVFNTVGELATSIFGQAEGGLLGLVKQIGAWSVRLSPVFWVLRGAVWLVKQVVDAVVAGIRRAQNLASTLTGGLVPAAGSGGGAANPNAQAGMAELREEIAQNIRQLNDQTLALGRASNAAAIFALQRRGANEVRSAQANQLWMVQSLAFGLDAAAEAARRSRTAIQDLQEAHANNRWAQANQGLLEQARQLTMTADQWELYRLRVEGASESMLRQTALYQRRRDILQQLQRDQGLRSPGAALDARSREAMMAAQEHLRRDQRTPEDELRDAIANQTEIQARQERWLERINQALRQRPEFVDVMGPPRS